MENYLLELIRENNRIIVPNFGAFIVSREKGQNILFNNFLSFNDGLLISHICAVEGVDSATATKKVENYVAQINAALDELGVYVIEGIGRFTKDDSGVLRFEQPQSDELGMDEKTAAEEASPEGDDEDFRSIDDNDLLDLESSGLEEDKDRIKSQPDEPTPYSAGSATAGIPSIQEIDSEIEDMPEEPIDSEYSTYISKRKRKRPVGFILFILLIFVLLAGASLWFYTDVLDDLKDKFIFKQEKTEGVKVPIKVEETEVHDEAGFVEEEVIEAPAVVSTRQHHVIVGSYREEATAQNQMQVLYDKGYTSASVFPYEDRFLLSVEWYPSVNKALERQEALLTELQMENWVLSLTVK